MFTMPAIHHPALRGDESPAGPMGAMHLNALNGSSNVLGYSDSSYGYSGQSGVFGGLFGVSLSDNHPYRPQDSGMTFHETCKSSHKSSTSSPVSNTSSSSAKSSSLTSSSFTSSSSPPSSSSSSSSAVPSSSSTAKTSSRHRDALASLRGSEMASPVGPRRRSLDLDTVSTNSCCRNDDRSLSLEELVGGSYARLCRQRGEVIAENDLAADLDLTGLSITEVQISTGEPRTGEKDKHTNDSTAKSVHTQKKRRRALTTDSATSERAIRLLEKIKDSKKDHNSGNSNGNFRHSRFRNEDSHEEPEEHVTSSSRTGSSRHHILRHLSDSAQQKQQREGHRHKDRKLLSRASVD